MGESGKNLGDMNPSDLMFQKQPTSPICQNEIYQFGDGYTLKRSPLIKL